MVGTDLATSEELVFFCQFIPVQIIPLHCNEQLFILFLYFEKNVNLSFMQFTGSHYTMMVGIFSYIGDITKESERTVRIGIISLTYSVGVPFGMAFSGILLRFAFKFSLRLT